MDDVAIGWAVEHRHIADRAFEEWVPRQCTDAWLEQVSGPARYRWDLEAMQQGFIEPIHRIAAARPERWRPMLCIALLRAMGIEPAGVSSVLAALELGYLAGAMLTRVKNGRTLAEATPDDMDLPLSVLSTVAFTAGTYAADLMARHTPFLQTAGRNRLIREFARVLARTSIGGAVDNYDIAPIAGGGAGVDGYRSHLRLCAGPGFVLPVDTALAVAGRADAAGTEALRAAAEEMSIGYQLATEVLMDLRPTQGRALDLPLEPSLQWRFADALAEGSAGGTAAHRRALDFARQATARAERLAREVPADLQTPLLDFMSHTSRERLRQAEGALHAQ